MKVGEAENELRQQLLAMYDESEAAGIASVVMQKITGFNRIERLTKKNEAVTPEQKQKFFEVTQRLSLSEPVQYVLGEAPFAGMNLYVNNSVLIPRPETEELVQWIVTDVKASGILDAEKEATDTHLTHNLKILDVGTGSGCIALALKKQMPKAEVWGCDISEEALNVARRNGSELDIRVDFQGINFLDEAQHNALPTVDNIVCNPPYIPKAQSASLHKNVMQYEPHTALFVPDDDVLIFYKTLAHFGQHRLYQNGAIYCEVHEDLGEDVVDLFKTKGYINVALKRDMQGKNRMIKAVKP